MSTEKPDMKYTGLQLPDRAGVWLLGGEEIEVYALEPVGGTLCVWGPDVGNSYTGEADTQMVWDTDEWQGHIPVDWFDDKGPWLYKGPPNDKFSDTAARTLSKPEPYGKQTELKAGFAEARG